MKIAASNSIVFSLIMLFGCSEIDKSFQGTLPDIVTYETHIKVILDQSCVRCHGGSEMLMNLNLSSYNEIELLMGTDVSSDIIVPGNSFSKLLRKTNIEGSMYMYLNNHRDYELIEQWVVFNGGKEK
jgi:hypothetical protein